MKTRFLHCSLLVFLSLSFSKMQAQIHPIPTTYSESLETIKQFGKGDTVLVGLDSVYVLNETQLQHYRLLLRLKKAVKDDNVNIERLFNDLIKSLSGDLAALKTLNDRMRQNADSTSAIGQNLANKTLQNVNKTDSLLVSAKTYLDSANVKLAAADLHLLQAIEAIKKEKKARWWRNVKWAGIGLGVGILTTLIFK